MSGRFTVRVRRSMLVGMLVISTIAASASTASANAPSENGIATFDGQILDLSQDWGSAEACFVWEQQGIVECFASEAAMDAWIAGIDDATPAVASGGITPAAVTCSGYLRLYDGTSYTGQVLYLRDRAQWINLSTYGFNQKTSSFKVGPCSSIFADYNNGGGDRYPTYLTQAYDQASSMLTGWNNDVTSVYIY